MTKARHLPHAGGRRVSAARVRAGERRPDAPGRLRRRLPHPGPRRKHPGSRQRVPPAHPARSGQWQDGTEMVYGAPSGPDIPPWNVFRQDAGTAACGARPRSFGPHVDGEHCGVVVGG